MLPELKGVFGKLKPQFDDDSIDRLNYIYTVFIIAVFALVVGAKQYVGKPIQCWVPAEFGKAAGWEKYAESYCFVENTYFLQPTEEFPIDPAVRTDKEMNYYQWVPVILALQALMFFLPRMVWNLFNFRAGLHVPGIIESVSNVTKDGKRENRRAMRPPKEHEEAQRITAEHIVAALKINMPEDQVTDDGSDDQSPPHYNNLTTSSQKTPLIHPISYSSVKPPTKAISTGSQTTVLYIFTKFLYVVNVVSQFFIMNAFFGGTYTFWGFEVLRDLLNNREWDTSGHFPRVTFCDFDIADIAQTRRYSVQCVMILNMFNEKIFLFLWWWFFVVAIINILNFFYWIAISFRAGSRKSFVKNYLDAKKINMQVVHSHDDSVRSADTNLSQFLNFLRPDGILILRLISDNVGDIVCSDVIAALWKAYWSIKESEIPADSDLDQPDGPQETIVESKKEL